MDRIVFQSNSPADQIACDETLLRLAEDGTIGECARTYEVSQPTIVLGIQDEYARAAKVRACTQQNVRILRRRSGGGTVLLAPGCLLYTLLLRRDRPDLRSVNASYDWILSRLSKALSTADIQVTHAGISDLAWKGRKVGGSAQQRKKNYLLHHGTLLYDMDISLLQQFIGDIRTEPDYRRGRSHTEFVTNLPFQKHTLVNAVTDAFEISPTRSSLPSNFSNQVRALVQERYGRSEWTKRR